MCKFETDSRNYYKLFCLLLNDVSIFLTSSDVMMKQFFGFFFAGRCKQRAQYFVSCGSREVFFFLKKIFSPILLDAAIYMKIKINEVVENESNLGPFYLNVMEFQNHFIL